MRSVLLNLFLSAMAFSVISCTHNKITNTNEDDINSELNSPFSNGSFEFSNRVDTVFPSYMEDVQEIDIRIPKSDSNKPFATIIVEPGFFSTSTDLENVKDRYASHGFLVVGVTNTSHYKLISTSLDPYKLALDQTIQYLLELNNLSSSSLFGLIDTNAIGVSGHSMGGGGVIMLCNSSSQYSKYVKTAIAMNPFGNCDASNISIPIYMFSSDKDNVINPFMLGKTSKPEDIFESFKTLSSSTVRLFANYKDMDHNGVVDFKLILPTSGNADVFLPTMLSWFKVYLENDNSFEKYLKKSEAEFLKLSSSFISHGEVPEYLYEY